MSKMPISRRGFLGSAALAGAAGFANSSTRANDGAIATTGVTLFAFDDVSIPHRRNLRLNMHQPQKHPANPVLPHGKPGEPDEYRAQFYGSIVREGGRFRMWYIAGDNDGMQTVANKTAYFGWRAAYAESEDGIHWNKPYLGLVEYRGNRRNNLLKIDPPDVTGLTLVLLHEPEDPDPKRRYKMMHQIRWAEAPAFGWTTSVPLFSRDGYEWKLETKGAPQNYAISTNDMPLPPEHTEQSGLYKWQGMYYLTGQQLSPWAYLADGSECGRIMTSFRSSDFVNWKQSKTLNYVRHGYVSMPQALGKESHSPASVWNRGNVLLGLHGLWNGAPNLADRTMPMGLLISNDGLHFREPVPDSVFVPHGEDGAWDARGLLSGQEFEHVGDLTYIWYGTWNLSEPRSENTPGAVGLLTMRRDGFGSLSPMSAGAPAELVTCTFDAGLADRLVVNADGLGNDARLRIELVDELERPVAGFSGDRAALVADSGVLTPVRWPQSGPVPAGTGPVRLQVTFEGSRSDRIQLYAVYAGAT
ncbi:MAG: hypothetical protein JNG89_00410 [Planctomycetaceae bacterium]|nr:hypothetical protein [Planctomycetaceae bacterium]